ncbi:MAG: DUF2207 domain-containing protein [candidate division KSB1 bacterium]|nr:DUF2207 domain-containing protein [candidate division KSB1 bacterium]
MKDRGRTRGRSLAAGAAWLCGRRRGALILAALAGLLPGHLCLAKDYRVDKIEVEALIRPDGSVRFTEKRVYAFRGAFSWASYELPLRGIARVESLKVWEGQTPFACDRSSRPGTFQVDTTGGVFRVKWHFGARNQTRVFFLSFVIPGLVRVHQDAAELFYNFLGAGQRKPVREVSVRIVWARAPAETTVAFWTHGCRKVTSHLAPEGVLLVRGHDVRPSEFLEVRVAFPLTCVPQLQMLPDASTLAEIRRQEADWARREQTRWQDEVARQESRRQREGHALWFLSFLTVAGVAAVVHLWLRFGKPYAVRGVGRFEGAPPAQRPPALVAYLLWGSELGPEVWLATLFDLARRGAVRFESEGLLPRDKRDARFRLRRGGLPAGELLEPWEEEVVRFLFDELAGGAEELSSEELKRLRHRLRQWFFGWRKSVIAAAEKQGWFEAESRLARNKTLGIAGALIALGLLFMVLAGWVGILPFLAGLVLFVLAFGMVRRTPQAQEEMLRWKAFARYLERVTRGEGAELPEDLRDRSWVYGLVLGIPSKRFRRLTERLFGSAEVPWLGVPPGAVVALMNTVQVVASVAGVGVGPAGGGVGGAVGRAG